MIGRLVGDGPALDLGPRLSVIVGEDGLEDVRNAFGDETFERPVNEADCDDSVDELAAFKTMLAVDKDLALAKALALGFLFDSTFSPSGGWCL